MNIILQCSITNWTGLKMNSFIYSRVRVMTFNATFNNISFISWQSVVLMEETGVPGENH